MSVFAKQSASAGERSSLPLLRSLRLSAAVIVRLTYITVLVLVVVWNKISENGKWVGHGALSGGVFTFLERHREVYGYHPVLMTVAFPVLGSEALLAFTHGKRGAPSRTAVAFHALCHLLALVCIVLALVAIAFFKSLYTVNSMGTVDTSGEPNGSTTDTSNVDMHFQSAVYSPHAWCGISTLCVWALNLGCGLVKRAGVLQPPAQARLRRLHAFFGKLSFAGGLASCALGYQDMQGSDLAAGSYGVLSANAQTASANGMLLLVLGAAVFAVLELKAAEEEGDGPGCCCCGGKDCRCGYPLLEPGAAPSGGCCGPDAAGAVSRGDAVTNEAAPKAPCCGPEQA